jgi:hypothetical protein
MAGRTSAPARSRSVGCSLSPCRAIRPQIQIRKPSLPEHGAIASQAGDGDRERLPQTSKTGEGRAPVRSAELEPGDAGIAAVPADDPPGEGVGRGRPGDSQLITSRPNNAEGIPTRARGPASGGAGSASMPVTTGCWLTAHADASDPNHDPSPREPVRRLNGSPSPREDGRPFALRPALALNAQAGKRGAAGYRVPVSGRAGGRPRSRHRLDGAVVVRRLQQGEREPVHRLGRVHSAQF